MDVSEGRVEAINEYATWYEKLTSEAATITTEAGDDVDKLKNNGNTERLLAENHTGRELLELIQNARDEIVAAKDQADDSLAGEIYIGVHDEGLVVANTGDSFDLLDDDVERAVRMVGESNKTDDDEELGPTTNTVGHIGVGLKSILSIGDTFEVWSNVDKLAEPLRVRYSRSYLSAAIARYCGRSVDTRELKSNFHDSFEGNIDTELFPEPNTIEKRDVPDVVGGIPLFWYPVALDPNTADSELARRCRSLVSNSESDFEVFDDPPAESFTTALFIEFRDDHWRDLLAELGIEPEKGLDEKPRGDRESVWETLSIHSERSSSLDVETLIHFQGIDDFYIENIGDDDRVEAAEHWSIRRDASKSVPHEMLSYERVFVEARIKGESPTYRCFDEFEHQNAPETHVSVLVDRTPELPVLADAVETPLSSEPTPDADLDRRIEYPLHLYYPIDATSEGRFPFCLHGRFRVATNRQDFSDDEKNHQVLEKGSDLIRYIGETTAELSPESPWWEVYPWLLLPPEPPESEPPSDPIDAPELLAYCKARIYDGLSDSACISTGTSPVLPTDVFIGTSNTVRKGVQSAATIRASLASRHPNNPTGEGTETRSLPTRTSLQALTEALDSVSDWNTRIGELLDHPSPESEFEAWVDWLAVHLDAEQWGDDVVTVTASDARRLFYGTVRVLEDYREESDTDMEAILRNDENEQRLDGVYLLPCLAESDDNSQLVATESRRKGEGGVWESGRRSSRTVIWDYETESRDYSFPPEYGDFDVYFLDPESTNGDTRNTLANAGQAWGVRKGDSPAELYKSLLEPLPDREDARVGEAEIAGLADLVTCYNENRAETLNSGELAFLDTDNLFEKVRSSGQDRRDERLRTNLRGIDLEIDGKSECIADIALSPMWAAIRERARATDADTAETGSVPDSCTTPPTDCWLPEPDALVNGKIDTLLADQDVPVGNVARVLSLLGSSRLPGLRYGWLLDRRLHPDPDMDYDTTGDTGENPHWWPTEWEREKIPTDVGRELHETLATALEGRDEYKAWITNGRYQTRAVIDHNKTCNVDPVSTAGSSGSYVATWVWFTDDGLEWIASHPDAVLDALLDHPEAYQSGLLRTYWYCQGGKGCSHQKERTIPTLANWQLRTQPIWSEILQLSDSADSANRGWDSDTLDSAIIRGADQALGWRLFPYIDPDSDRVPDEALLEDLGVKRLGELNASQAAQKLQQVQEAFADAPTGLDDDAPTQLDIPNQRYWDSARTKLFEPILEYVDEHSDADSWEDVDLPMLTHLPLRRGTAWFSAPINWIAGDDRDALVKYLSSTPTPWEKRALTDPDSDVYSKRVYELRRQEHRGFDEFTTILGVGLVKAPDPTLDADQFKTRQCDVDGLNACLRNIRRELQNRLDLLIAIQELETQDSIDESRTELGIAIENLAVVKSLPDETTNPLSKTGSGTYYLQEGGDSEETKGLVLNLGGIDEISSASDLSELSWPELKRCGIVPELGMGFALVTENYRARNDFESILDLTEDKADLIKRLKKDTFPIEEVRSHLESDFEHSVRQRVRASSDLVENIAPGDLSLPDLETIVQALESRESDARIVGGLEAVFNINHSNNSPEPIVEYVRTVQSLPDPYRRLVEGLYVDTSDRDWRSLLQFFERDRVGLVIKWWVTNERFLPADLTADIDRTTARRLAEVSEVNDSLSIASADPIDWKTELDSVTANVQWQDVVPAEIQTDTSTDTRWIEVSPASFEDGLSAWLDRIQSEASNDDLPAFLEEYIRTGSLQTKTDREFRADSMSRAGDVSKDAERDFSILQTSSSSGGSSQKSSIQEKGQSVSGSVHQDSSGYPTKGRGEDAEIATAIKILDDLTEWIKRDPETHYDRFVKHMYSLHDEQSECDYAWHKSNVWGEQILDLLESGLTADDIEARFLSWRTDLEQGSLDDSPLFRMLDVSQEGGPGFDMIDPLGPTPQDETADRELASSPIEVKAVGRDPPYSIRLTTNEYQQCLKFVTTPGRDYVLRLVYVPESDNRVANATLQQDIVIESKADLRELIPLREFERNVRQGTISLDIE
ncbi:hypothetical protein ACFQE8_24755 [Salinirubellus sp. GCM10025818]|uniref:hypothetical protein n=1 Tax=Salinirubellus TaxID=2162630 RepID=UPI0030CABD4F